MELPRVGRAINRPGATQRGGALTLCKADDCQLTIYAWQDRVWCSDPLGLVHLECAERLELSHNGDVTSGVSAPVRRR